MLLQEHCGKNDQYGQRKGAKPDSSVIFQSLAVGQRHVDGKRVEYMNAGKDVGRCVCHVKPSHCICKEIVSGKFHRS